MAKTEKVAPKQRRSKAERLRDELAQAEAAEQARREAKRSVIEAQLAKAKEQRDRINGRIQLLEGQLGGGTDQSPADDETTSE